MATARISRPRPAPPSRCLHQATPPGTQRRGRSTKPCLASGSLTTWRRIPWAAATLATASPAYPSSTHGQLDLHAGGFLDRARQGCHLRALVLVGGRDGQRVQAAQGVDGGMDVGALAPLVPVVACALAALGARLQHAGVEGGRRRLRVAVGHRPQQRADRAPGPRNSRGLASGGLAGRRWARAGTRAAASSRARRPAQSSARR